MRTLLRLGVAGFFLGGAVGSCAVAYLVGYSQGLNVQANTTTEVHIDDVPTLELHPDELHASILDKK